MSSTLSIDLLKTKTRRFAWCSLAVFFLVPSTSSAYVPSTTTKSLKPLRWMGSNCIHIRVNAAGSEDIRDGSDLLAVKNSIENWEKVVRSCSYLRFIIEQENINALPGFDKDSSTNENVIYWQEKSWPHDPDAAALTTVTFIDKIDISSDGQIIDADIEMNGVKFIFSTDNSNKFTDIENTITHELGHLMGLDHPCDDGTRVPVPVDHTGAIIPQCKPIESLPQWMVDSTMFNFTDPGEIDKRTPESDDIKGICDTYPLAKDPKVCQRPNFWNGDNDGCSTGGATSISSWMILFFLFGALLLLVYLPRLKRQKP